MNSVWTFPVHQHPSAAYQKQRPVEHSYVAFHRGLSKSSPRCRVTFGPSVRHSSAALLPSPPRASPCSPLAPAPRPPLLCIVALPL